MSSNGPRDTENGMVIRLALMTLCIVVVFRSVEANDATEFDPAVRALLKARCLRCHGPNKPKAGLNLSSPAAITRGGEHGAVVVAGKLDQSLLWERVSAGEMPPDKPLPVAEKETLRKWIAAGATGLQSGAVGVHWAFRAFTNSAPPPFHNLERVRNAVDRHIQARLEQEKLSIGPEADPRTLIRRVSLDVTGLPPTPDAVEQFLSDTSASAYEKMVERYLASPRFGERWGKHWLDAAGYADSNGYFSADTDRPHAWRYRDYVIRSLNTDKPFDQFIREQLAGDELAGFKPGEATDRKTIDLLVATHFLRNGQDGTDIGVQEPEAFEIDRRAALEAAVQVTASSLLGLTVHCARCHDHKFEPITQKEYYQFQPVLFPAFNPQDWVNPKDRVIYAYLPGEKETWESNENRIKQALARNRDEFREFLNANREPSDLVLQETFGDDSWKSRWSNTAPGDDRAGGKVTLEGTTANAARVVDGALQVIAGPSEAWLSTTAKIDWTPELPGDWIQASFHLVDNKVGSGTPAMRIGYTIAAHDYDDSGSVAGGNILVDGNPTTATQLYTDYPGDDQKNIGQLGQQGYVPGRDYGVRVTNIGDGKFRLDHIVDGLPDGKTLDVTASDLPDGGFAFFYCCNRSYIVDDVRIERNQRDVGSGIDVAELRKKLVAKRKDYEKRRGELEAQRTPEPGRAIAWVTDKSAKPPEVPLLTRGLYNLRGPGVPPGVFQMLTDEGREYQPRTLSEGAATTGRRLGFADWLLRAEGRPAALLARVHANRIWREYFGRGIVATTDNLGQSGSHPTHPALLDDLARGLIQSGWKQKSLHRRILLSAVYRQSAAARTDGLAVDPDNRLYWRRSVRRLQAEVIRDSILAASGQLDATPFGPYVPTRQTPVGEVVVDAGKAGAARRSVYLQQRRSQTLSMLKVFDAPAIATVCTSRPSSTVPLQSLAMLNSDFVVSTAEAFANRLLAETNGTDEALIRRSWLIAAAREPTDREKTLCREFLTNQRTRYSGSQAAAAALSDMCQMLLASHAFLYVE